MCFISTFAVNPGFRIPLSITFRLEAYVLSGKGRGQKKKQLSLIRKDSIDTAMGKVCSAA